MDMIIRRYMRSERRQSDGHTWWSRRMRTALLVCTLVAVLWCLLAPDAMAKAPTLEQQLTALITKHTGKVLASKDSQDRWVALEDLQKAVRRFEDVNDAAISSHLRVAVYRFLFYLDAMPPLEESFRKEDCGYYRARLHDAAQTTSRRQFDFYAEAAAKVIDSFCK